MATSASPSVQLELRQEFAGKKLKGTAIDLANEANTGATQVPASHFLEYTYPTHDLLKAIEAVGPDQARPVVVMGERGLGKSHLMATLFHAVNDPDSTQAWLERWATTLNDARLSRIPLRRDMLVIGASMHNHRYKFLWDLLFDKHPHGAYIRGKWEAPGHEKTDVPSDLLMLEMLRNKPVMLLLDEYQTWFDGLTSTKQYPHRNWAFNFIQILSEIAKEHPDLLVLVVSVRTGETDAYQQIHRVNPVQIDFKAGGTPEKIQQDRRRMLLHRLFANRLQVSPTDIDDRIKVHVGEYFRLLGIPSTEQPRRRAEFIDAWPYAPHLLQLLEDQVLVATDAQETRDLIRILANLFKSGGSSTPILTAADFDLEDEGAGIGALLDSVANKHHTTLRERAMRNLTAVRDALSGHTSSAPVPTCLKPVLASLWLRSIAVDNLAGAEPATLHVDITRDKPVDDNLFAAELATIVENSFNIHQVGPRLVFLEEENPQAKLMAMARNDKLFTDGSDREYLAREIRYVLGSEEAIANKYRVIPLPQTWVMDMLGTSEKAWEKVPEGDRPQSWDSRIPILVLPEYPDQWEARLGKWLATMLQARRNTVRFLLPRPGLANVFFDRDLIILARAELKAGEWSRSQPEYKRLFKKYQDELRDQLNKRFDRFAILARWDFNEPSQCRFSVEMLNVQGKHIPEAIQKAMAEDLYEPEEFEALVAQAAQAGSSLGKLLSELQEPRPRGLPCIPWLGEVAMKESLLRLCARGKVAIDKRGLEMLQALPGESEAAAWTRLKPRLDVGGHQLNDVRLLEPSAVPAVGGGGALVAATTPQPGGITNPQPGGGGPADLTGGSSGSGTAWPSHALPGGGGTQPELGISTGGEGSQSGTNLSTGGGPQPGSAYSAGGGAQPGASIFGGGTRPRVNHAHEPTAPLNLIGRMEAWGITPATRVPQVSLSLSDLTGAQLKDLLKKLPDGLKVGISIDKEVD